MFLGHAACIPDGGGHLRGRGRAQGPQGEPPDVPLTPPS